MSRKTVTVLLLLAAITAVCLADGGSRRTSKYRRTSRYGGSSSRYGTNGLMGSMYNKIRDDYAGRYGSGAMIRRFVERNADWGYPYRNSRYGNDNYIYDRYQRPLMKYARYTNNYQGRYQDNGYQGYSGMQQRGGIAAYDRMGTYPDYDRYGGNGYPNENPYPYKTGGANSVVYGSNGGYPTTGKLFY